MENHHAMVLADRTMTVKHSVSRTKGYYLPFAMQYGKQLYHTGMQNGSSMFMSEKASNFHITSCSLSMYDRFHVPSSWGRRETVANITATNVSN